MTFTDRLGMLDRLFAGTKTMLASCFCLVMEISNGTNTTSVSFKSAVSRRPHPLINDWTFPNRGEVPYSVKRELTVNKRRLQVNGQEA